MAKSLQEQLLGAGIVDKKKANKIKAEKLQTKQKMKKQSYLLKVSLTC